MSNTRTAEEVLRANIAAMGKDLGEVFTELSNELTLLSWQTQQLAELYGNAERLKLVNAAAPFFFWLLQRSWWEESLLGITRLLAPKRSMGKTNLTFQQLPDLIDDSKLQGDIRALVASVVKEADFAKQWRDKRIAHRDLDHSLNKSAFPLPTATLEDVKAVLTKLEMILNSIERHYCDSTTIYANAPISHDAIALLYVIRDGLRREELRQNRLESTSEYHPEDWNDDLPPL